MNRFLKDIGDIDNKLRSAISAFIQLVRGWLRFSFLALCDHLSAGHASRCHHCSCDRFHTDRPSGCCWSCAPVRTYVLV